MKTVEAFFYFKDGTVLNIKSITVSTQTKL